MELELSPLIRQIQASLREEAGLPSSDRADPSLPPLPSIADAINALDDTGALTSSLCCESCGVGLPCGRRSLVCIYCGAEQRDDGAPHEMSFASTAACRWLLNSLRLDGSEPVMLDTESTQSIESSKGPDTTKRGVVLSDILDLKLRWPSDREDPTESDTKREPPTNTYTLSLSGADLDSFFSETKREMATAAPFSSNDLSLQKEEQSINSKSDAFSGREGVILSESFQSSTMKVDSHSITNSGFAHSLTDWEADFQSPRSESYAVETMPVDLFKSSPNKSSVANAVATVQQRTEVEKETNIQGIIAGKDVGQPFSNSNLVQNSEPAESEQLGSGNVLSSGETDIHGPKTSTLIKERVESDMGLVSCSKESDNAAYVNDADENFDDWQGFTSSVEAQGSLPNLTEQTSVMLLGHSSGTNSAGLLPVSSSKTLDTVTLNDNDEDSFDDWQDFASYDQTQGILSNPGAQTLNYAFEHPSKTKSMNLRPENNIEEFNNTASVEINDSSDEWQDFTSSNQVREGSLDSMKQSLTSLFEHPSTTVNNDLQDFEFELFMHSNSLSKSPGGEQRSNEANTMIMDALASDRVNGAHHTAGDDTQIVSLATTPNSQNRDIIEKLLSQMPDLSFMLKDELSIPDKLESFQPIS